MFLFQFYVKQDNQFFSEELYNDENNFQGKNHQDQGSSNQALNGFWLTLNKWRLVEIFEELLITIPFNMDEDK